MQIRLTQQNSGENGDPSSELGEARWSFPALSLLR